MAIISANLQFNRGGHGLLDYSSLQTNYSAALTWAKDPNSNAAVGQFIYLADAETIDGVDYAKGPYVVDAIGENAVLTPLSKSVAGNPDLASLVSNLQGEVGTLKTGLATTDSSVNALETTVNAIDETYATKAEVEEAIGNVDFSSLATKEELSNGLAEKADASAVYSKTDADSTFVKSAGYVAFSEDEKNKLAGIAAGAEVNYIKSVGDNLAVDDKGKLTVSIPEVEVPFQSVAEGDKVLTLNEGVLSSTLSYARETVEGVDSLVLKGVNGVVIGSVPVADFIADGMLESVTPEEGTNNFIFTFKTGNGTTESFKVDFSKYVDTYYADETTIELKVVDGKNVFNVKEGVFEAAGEAAKVQTALTNYISTNDAAVAAKVNSSDYNTKVAEIDGSISSIKGDLANKANAADVYTSIKVDELLGAKVNSSDYNTKVAEIDGSISSINTELAKKAVTSEVETALAGKVDVVEGSSLVSDELITKLGNMVEIKSVGGDLTFADGALSLDLSEYAKSTDVANTYVAKEEGKGLSTNDLTDDLLAKLNGIAAGAEVNYIKSVGDNLAVSDAGKLTVDLSAKLDASAKVNGVSFVNGEATLDAGDIALEAAITRTGKDGEVENVYGTETSIQSVLANLSQRIDILDPTVSGELGITSIVAGVGVDVQTSGEQATIAVKASASEGNIAEVKTDGIYVAAPEVPDMRSYWETI